MKKENLTYDQAAAMIASKMGQLPNVRKFCTANNINYNIALSIKNGKAKKPYPNVVLKFLKALKFKAVLNKEYTYSLN